MSRLAPQDGNASFGGRPRSASLCSFDLARIAAISLVAMQHLLTISNHKPPLLLDCLNIGQLGVTVFCALSGYFSLRSSKTNNLRWIARRLKRIFIPYWISLIAIFTVNSIVGYKPVSPGLIASEFLGTALFTHPGSLVGVHVWFISLILLCYAIAFVLRWKPATLPIFALIAVTAFFWGQPLVAGHVLSFLAGCALSKCITWTQRLRIGVLAAAICAAGLAFVGTCFAYPIAATVVLLLCNAPSATSPAWLTPLSETCYEFFLVHGPIYLGLAKFAHFGIVANLAIGTSLAIIAAILLRAAASLVCSSGEVVWKYVFLHGLERTPSQE
jgi:peptidoglycan/LPS O-acetylase OafA/YrhL